MKKINLKSAPNGTVMSNKELKDIVGGSITSCRCDCHLHSGSEDLSGGGAIGMPPGSTSETCEYSCLELCVGTSGCTNITFEYWASGATHRNY